MKLLLQRYGGTPVCARTGLYEIEPVPDELGGGNGGPIDEPSTDPNLTEVIPPEPVLE